MNGYKSIYYKGQGDIGNLFFSVNSDYAKQGNATKNRINYTTGGAPLVGRSYTAPNTSYRFGYNLGSEKDDEISGEGNNYTTYFREIDVRLLRMWSDDPTRKAWESPYVLNHNSFLIFVDPFGDDPPKRLKFFGTGGRLDNFMKGDDYKNKANKYAVDNNIDETKITSGWNIVKKTNYISMRMPYKKGEVGGAVEKMFLDSDPVDGNPSDWAGNCPFKTVGLSVSYKVSRGGISGVERLSLYSSAENHTGLMLTTQFDYDVGIRNGEIAGTSNDLKREFEFNIFVNMQTYLSTGVTNSTVINGSVMTGPIPYLRNVKFNANSSGVFRLGVTTSKDIGVKMSITNQTTKNVKIF